jgi:hypothetical protein
MVDCKDCVWFREAPYRALKTGCYYPDNMPVRQKVAYLDEQQQPGDHRKINAKGDCKDFEAKPKRPSLLQWLLGKSA